MFKSKRDVDRHVQDVFRHITVNKEKNLRCYNVAKLYFKVGDYHACKQYVELYLKERPEVAGAHKLLGQAFEELKDYGKALEEYKISLTLDSKQTDLVVKVCEMLVKSESSLNPGEAKYWVERGEEFAETHPAVFLLKEHIIKMENGSGDQVQLTELLKREIDARPHDHVPRIRLLKLYLGSNEVPEAYKYALDIESRSLFHDNLQWYHCVVEVFKAYHRETKNLDDEFYINQLCVMERCVALCSQDQSACQSTAFISSLHDLDQTIFEASNFRGEELFQECLSHIMGQLSFHLGTALLRIAKRSQTYWKEWTPFAWALMMHAYCTVDMKNTSSSAVLSEGKKHRKLMKLWKEDGAYRCSQAGYILLSMSQEKNRFNQLNQQTWRERVYNLIFAAQMKENPNISRGSFFLKSECFAEIPQSSPSLIDIEQYNVFQLQRADSLNSLVWLGLRHVEPGFKHMSPIRTPYVLPYRLSPSFAFHVFEELKLFTSEHLENARVETLSKLDVDTFVYASVFCAAAAQDLQHSNICGERGKPLVLPVDLTESLCSESQAKWWSSVCRLHASNSRSDIGEVRMTVSRGLEAVRLQGNHGMDVRLVVLLAKLFAEKASSTFTPKDYAPSIRRRAQLFWTSAVSLLERNKPHCMHKDPLFLYEGKELTKSDIELLLEEGRFFIAHCLMIEGRSEEAINAFEVLKNPYASFNEGLMYKKLADKEMSSFPTGKYSDQDNSQYIIFLQKSLSAFYLTLDRLRSPQYAGKHPLNADLEQHLKEVESCLQSLEGLDGSRAENLTLNASLYKVTSTPFKSSSVSNANAYGDTSYFVREEARPSPERLDAQFRAFTMQTDSVLRIVCEKNEEMLQSHKIMMESLDKTRQAVEGLQKRMADLQLEVGRLKQTDDHGRNFGYSRPVNAGEDHIHGVAAFPPQTHQSFSSLQTNPPFAIGRVPGPGVLSTMPFDLNILNSIQSQSVVGMNFSERHGVPVVPLPSALPNMLPVTSSNSLSGSIPSHMHSTVVASSSVAHPADSLPTMSHVVGAPLVSYSTLLDPGCKVGMGSEALPPVQQDMGRQLFGMMPQSSTPSKPPMPNLDSVPHNFQISMPPQAMIPTAESLEKSLSPLKPVSTEAVLQNVPMPTYSAVSLKKLDTRPSRRSTESVSGNDTYTEDADYNPCADFKPIVPLPAEITVTTGEEDETPLFVRRAKLFRYCTREWKERGVGDIKILKHNCSGKVRILMRREQVLKICANHFILPEMELTAHTSSDRAWSWAANDFSEGEARIEKLCVRFKTVEDAQDFKKAFDEARELAKVATPKDSAPASQTRISEVEITSTPATTVSGKTLQFGGFSFSTPPILKPVEHETKTNASKEKENVSTTPKQSPFQGFSFTSAPNIFKPNPVASSIASTSVQSTTPFISAPVFSKVTSSPSLPSPKSSQPIASTVSVTAANDSTIFTNNRNLTDFAALAAQHKGVEVKKDKTNFKGFEGAGTRVFGGVSFSTSDLVNKSDDVQESADTEEFEPTAVFNPVVPLPGLIEVRTGEEDEEVLFEERAKLLRFEKEWKERGVGKIRVLKNPQTGKVRLLMRREQVLKVCCNHFLTADMQFKTLTTSDKAITWSAQDFSEGEVRGEVLALRFKTPERMHDFKAVMERLQKEMGNNIVVSAPAVGKKENDKPLSELFKPKEGSWECNGCYTRNNADQISCLCCTQPKPVSETMKVESKPLTGPANTSVASVPAKGNDKPLSELFKPKEGSWECNGCYTRNNADQISCLCCTQPKPVSETMKVESKPLTGPANTSVASVPAKGNDKPLSELFKPKEGSWECNGCYTRNDADQISCLCCTQPKPGCEAVVDKKKVSSKPQFSFGIPPDSNQSSFLNDSKAVASNVAFSKLTFGINNSSAGQQLDTSGAKPTFVFGVPSSSTAAVASKGFGFGIFGSATTPTTSSGFVFGTQAISTTQTNQPPFGSPHQFEFEMKATSPGKSPGRQTGDEESEDDEVEENPDVGDFKPVVPLPDKVPVLTGEEDETVLYCNRAKLFRFVSQTSDANPLGAGGEWKERGVGDIKVLCHNKTSKPRLLMRRDQVLKICLNHFISPDLDLKKKDEKTWLWGAQDFSESVISVEKFACRFKTAEIAAEFKEAVDKAKALTVLPSPIATEKEATVQTSGPSAKEAIETLKNVTSKLPTGKPNVARSLFGEREPSISDDIQVVYEAKVTQEEKDAAIRLKLPENFYLYKQAPPCKGCPGCEEDEQTNASVNPLGYQQIASPVTKLLFEGSSSPSSNSRLAPDITSNTTLLFGGSSSTGSSLWPVSDGTFSFGSSISGIGNTAVNSHSTAFPKLGSILSADSSKEDQNLSILSDNNSLSFANLAAASGNVNIFKSNKSFTFEGAGSKVFSSSPSESTRKSKNDEEADSGEENDATETGDDAVAHDPQFEPIIAMPDVIEVHTGEEEEERIFCQRAKLFRYDTNAKEWKERGVGEMRILKHPKNGTYRLLLRRDQVHKVVLNQLIDAYIKLKALLTSDRAWCWGGINHAEEQSGTLEELAVKFKTPEQADEFRSKLEECQKIILEGAAKSQVCGLAGEEENAVEEEEKDEEKGDGDDDDEYEDDENGTYEDISGDLEILFQEPILLVAEIEGSPESTIEGPGIIRVIKSDDYSYEVVVSSDDDQTLCRTLVIGDCEVQRIGEVCEWKGFDIANDSQPIEKKFKTIFESENEADAFQELYSNITLEIVERSYHYVDDQDN